VGFNLDTVNTFKRANDSCINTSCLIEALLYLQLHLQH
jgi:hypothetical protein